MTGHVSRRRLPGLGIAFLCIILAFPPLLSAATALFVGKKEVSRVITFPIHKSFQGQGHKGLSLKKLSEFLIKREKAERESQLKNELFKGRLVFFSLDFDAENVEVEGEQVKVLVVQKEAYLSHEITELTRDRVTHIKAALQKLENFKTIERFQFGAELIKVKFFESGIQYRILSDLETHEIPFAILKAQKADVYDFRMIVHFFFADNQQIMVQMDDRSLHKSFGLKKMSGLARTCQSLLGRSKEI